MMILYINNKQTYYLLLVILTFVKELSEAIKCFKVIETRLARCIKALVF